MKRLAMSLTALSALLASSSVDAAVPRLRFEETADGGVYLAGRLMPDTQVSAAEMRSLAGGPSLRFVGVRRDARLVGEQALPGVSHDLRHVTSSSPVRDLRHFARLRVHDAWPGIQIVHREGQGALEHDFVVAPGADASRIRIAFGGAKRVGVLEEGTLVAQGRDGELRLKAPIAWQEGERGREPVACAWRVRGGRASFVIGEHDASRELVIDPEIAWSTYMGGPGNSAVEWLAVVPDGSILAAVYGRNIPTTPGAYSAFSSPPATLCAISRLAADGSTILWASYLPPFNFKTAMRLDDGSMVAVGDSGVESPVVGGRQSAGESDGYVAILSSDGSSLLAAGFFGGPGSDGIRAIARATNGDFILGGGTQGNGFAADVTLGPGQGAPSSHHDGLLLRVTADLSTILHSTRIGGTLGDEVLGVALMPADGDILATFTTDSADFPTVHAAQPTAPARHPDCPFGSDGAVARLAPDLSELGFSTYLAGSCHDFARGVAVDAAGEIVVSGATESADFPIVDAWQPAPGGGMDQFLVRLSSNGELVTSTYVGGSGEDFACDVVSLDGGSRVLVAGASQSPDFPRMDALGLPAEAPSDAAQHATVARFDIDGGMEFSTTLGGTAPIATNGRLTSLALATAGAEERVLLGGWTMAADYPTTPGSLHESAPADPSSGLGIRMSGFVTSIDGTISALSEVSAVGSMPSVVPLTIRDAGPSLVLGWEETHGGGQDQGSRIVVYVGTLISLHGGRYDHQPAVPCSFDVPPASIETPPGNVYLLVARAKDDESSLGRDSFGRERPHPRTPCP